MKPIHPTKRFSARVESYSKYRPTYPDDIIDCLSIECNLTTHSLITDVGSGTGLLSQLFLDNGNTVIGIEPNNEMRISGDALLSRYTGFTSLPGTAENTGAPDNSTDFVIAGHAAHWFNAQPAKTEFHRILKPQGTIALIWNTRNPDGSDFMAVFEDFMHHFARDEMGQPGFEGGQKRDPGLILGDKIELRTFHNEQSLDNEGLLGRVQSSSMMPLKTDHNYDEMKTALHQIFLKHQINDTIKLHYKTELFFTICN